MIGPSTRKILQDRHLIFNCFQFSRGATAERPRSRRWVSADQCRCTHDPNKILDATLAYTIHFREASEEEEAQEKKESEKYGMPPDCIGEFESVQGSWINVPSDFLDLLWAAAIAADGVLRSIELTVQRQGGERWAIFEVRFSEKMGEPFEVQYDKRSRATIIPPHPVVRELRAQRKRRVWSGIGIIAVGVLIALSIAKLWH
jgi:hypothetical protein